MLHEIECQVGGAAAFGGIIYAISLGFDRKAFLGVFLSNSDPGFFGENTKQTHCGIGIEITEALNREPVADLSLVISINHKKPKKKLGAERNGVGGSNNQQLQFSL
jgi:hypothetical protein